MKKQCRVCKQTLDSSSFCGSSKEPDGLARLCTACVNNRRRELYAGKRRDAGDDRPLHLREIVKRGDYAALKQNRRSITPSNRQPLLALAVMDFKSAPKKKSHVELVKLLMELGAKPDFQLVCAATVGHHVEIMNVLIEAGAEHNIFTAAALGEVDRVRELLTKSPVLINQTTGCAFYDLLGEQDMTPLHYTSRSELGKVSESYAERLFQCAELLIDQRSALATERGLRVTPLDLCASRGGNTRIARLLITRGCRPTIITFLHALGHFQRHGAGNYDVAALCLEAGVNIDEREGGRTLLHAFANQGDLVATRWLLDHGAEVDARDQGNNTPLQKACERNSTLSVVKLLLERGASRTATNNDGETALDLAIKNDKKKIAAYLKGIKVPSALVPGHVPTTKPR
jgi:ankyrin repeat protein